MCTSTGWLLRTSAPPGVTTNKLNYRLKSPAPSQFLCEHHCSHPRVRVHVKNSSRMRTPYFRHSSSRPSFIVGRLVKLLLELTSALTFAQVSPCLCSQAAKTHSTPDGRLVNTLLLLSLGRWGIPTPSRSLKNDRRWTGGYRVHRGTRHESQQQFDGWHLPVHRTPACVAGYPQLQCGYWKVCEETLFAEYFISNTRQHWIFRHGVWRVKVFWLRALTGIRNFVCMSTISHQPCLLVFFSY